MHTDLSNYFSSNIVSAKTNHVRLFRLMLGSISIYLSNCCCKRDVIASCSKSKIDWGSCLVLILYLGAFCFVCNEFRIVKYG